MVPLVAAHGDAGRGLLVPALRRAASASSGRWPSSPTSLGMLLIAPLVLAWSRARLARGAATQARARLPELVVLYVGPRRHHALSSSRSALRRDGIMPPLAYLCAPFLIWAALRFGLRAATLGLAVFGLICYWHTAHGFGPFAVDRVADVAVAAAPAGLPRHDHRDHALRGGAAGRARGGGARDRGAGAAATRRVIRASGKPALRAGPGDGRRRLGRRHAARCIGTTRDELAPCAQWMRARASRRPRAAAAACASSCIAGEISHIAIEYRMRRDDGEYTTRRRERVPHRRPRAAASGGA